MHTLNNQNLTAEEKERVACLAVVELLVCLKFNVWRAMCCSAGVVSLKGSTTSYIIYTTSLQRKGGVSCSG